MTDGQKNDNSLEKQYQNLWDNMQQTNSHNFTLIIGIIAASGAILTTAFSNLKEIQSAQVDPAIIGGIFMSVYMITIPGQLLLNSNRHHIWQLSTYIQIFLEPHLEFLKWETNIAKRDNLEKNELFSDVIGNEYLITLLINLTASIAAFSSFYFSSFLTLKFKILCIILTIMCWISYSWFFGLRMKSLKRGGKIEESNYKAWTKIKEMT